jgi:hypothetical protein
MNLVLTKTDSTEILGMTFITVSTKIQDGKTKTKYTRIQANIDAQCKTSIRKHNVWGKYSHT